MGTFSLKFYYFKAKLLLTSNFNSMKKSIEVSGSHLRLKQIINNKRLRSEFRKYLQKEFCEETLDFCVEIDQFIKTKDKKKQVLLAYSIVNTYIGKNAKFPINLDSTIISDIRFRSKFDFDSTLFDEALRHVKL